LRNPVAHPLDPLSGEEFRAVASILQREHGVVAGAGGPATSNLGWRFASIELAEPGKTELRAFDDGGPPPPRRAEVICLQRSNNATYKSLVSLTDDRVLKQRAPFDHPELFVPNGHFGDGTSVPSSQGLALDRFITIPAVGRNGGPALAKFLEQ